MVQRDHRCYEANLQCNEDVYIDIYSFVLFIFLITGPCINSGLDLLNLMILRLKKLKLRLKHKMFQTALDITFCIKC